MIPIIVCHYHKSLSEGYYRKSKSVALSSSMCATSIWILSDCHYRTSQSFGKSQLSCRSRYRKSKSVGLSLWLCITIIGVLSDSHHRKLVSRSPLLCTTIVGILSESHHRKSKSVARSISLSAYHCVPLSLCDLGATGFYQNFKVQKM